MQIPTAGDITLFIPTFQGVPENLTQPGSIWPQCRIHTLRQKIGWKGIQFFQDPASAPIEFDIFFKNDIDTGKTKHGRTTNGLNAGNSKQGSCKRISNLIFNILGRASCPFGKNNLLVFTNIGNRVYRDRICR